MPHLQGATTPPGDDFSLLSRLAAGDMDAAAQLYDRYCAQVYALARRIVRNDGDAEDVVQEVFSQAWRTVSRFDRARGSVVAWLLMMTRTRSIDRVRARRSRPDTEATVSPDMLKTADVPDVVVTTEQSEIVREALESLPPPQRTALELAYFEGLTQAEIAARLAEPLGTIKTRMRTALNALRTKLRT